MDRKYILSTTAARKNIFKITEDVQKPGRYYTLTEKGRAKAVIMSAEEFDCWQETVAVATEFPDLKKDLIETDKAVKSGEYKKWPTLADLMAKHGFAVADKSKKKYVVDDKAGKKRAKRLR